MLKNKKIIDRETTIGILGGMGPYATNFFLKRILDLTDNGNSNQEAVRKFSKFCY